MGTKVFHVISSRISDRENYNHPNISGLGIKLCNLKPLSRSIITTHRSVRLSNINSQSITNKIDSFHTELLDNEVDLCAVTETWIKPDDIDSVTHKWLQWHIKFSPFLDLIEEMVVALH